MILFEREVEMQFLKIEYNWKMFLFLKQNVILVKMMNWSYKMKIVF